NFAMRIMGGQFVLGRSIEEALSRGEEWAKRGFRFSFDMLGEAAVTAGDADRYFTAYSLAIAAIGKHADARHNIFEPNSIPVKLSALPPRFEYLKRDRVFAEMLPKVVALGRAARNAGIGFTIDAEEADRLDLQLDVFEAAGMHSDLKGWEGLGLAIQAY